MNSGKPKSEEPGKDKILPQTDAGQFPIVGVGASAGGFEALEQFFTNMPNDSGMAFVVIQHLDPNHIGILPELLQRITPMKVIQASDRLKVQPNCVYVIPPKKSMSLLNGALHLFDPVESRGLRLPIDIFFRSLAADMEEKSIGIILSGMGSDGSLGLKAIKEKNGMALVQSCNSAKFDGMPFSATEAVIADIVAPAEELPAKLITFLKFSPAGITDADIDSKNKSNLDKIIILLREQTGHDFSLYKKNTLFRRIERRKGIHQIDKIQYYVRFLQDNPNEVEILFKELLIGVTSFFRDPAVWEMLKNRILPALLNELPTGYVLRAWVTACSTGEEAYSLAIVFQEALEKIKKRKNLSLQIFATDLDPDAIEIARKGYFSNNITTDVAPERLSRFFKVSGDGYCVITPIREMVVFATQNVIKDPPFTKLDLLTCRNLLIYLEPELQKKLMLMFNYSLNQGGIMLLGTAETLGTNKEGFEEVDSRLKFFKRTLTTIPHTLIDFPSSFSRLKRVTLKEPAPTKSVENLQTITEQLMIQRFAPASALVNNKGDIIFITGRTGKYLEPVAGKANHNIYAMAREGLREALPNAFRKATTNFEQVIVRNLKVETNGGSQLVDITVQCLESPDAVRGMVIVVFTDAQPMVEHDMANQKTGKRRSTGKIRELEIKLQRSYEDLQTAREEMQTSQEELKSTNEELQSTNEELQLTNEELTTSKEEMQSLNEELQTMNVELQSKVNDFVQANNDMKNLLNSTEVATLFLDKELNIRRFTEAVTKIIKLRNSDIGRPFTDQVSNLKYPEIESHAHQVLKTLASIETAITSQDGRWFDIRIMPYRTLDDRIDGLVITFTDITFVKLAGQAMTVSETRYRRIFESAKDGILILDAETGKIVDVNPFLIEMLGYSKEQFLEKAIWEIGFLKDIIANKDKFLELQKKEIVRYENLPLETADGRKINVEFISNVYLVADYKVIQCFVREISDRRLVEEYLQTKAEQNRIIIKTAMDGFLLTDKYGRLMEVNDAYCRMSGYCEQELLTMNITDLSVKTASEIFGRLQKIAADGSSERFESQRRRKDGSLFDVEVTIQYQPVSGLFVIFIRDVAGRK
ncbi:MAG: chemotaxis protein CheB [Bacteroidota bacterium]